MSEFGNLEHDAEQYAKDHPQQVKEGEQDAEHEAESKFGFGGGQGGQGGQGQSGQGQDSQSGQDSQPAADNNGAQDSGQQN
jgi:hypothetical protein